ncbi:MAG: AAA family ATPase, partial [archaeon]
PSWIEKLAEKQKYDLYLLLDTDVPFVPDRQRYLKNGRQLSLERCINELEAKGANYVLVSGAWNQRMGAAVKEVEKLLEAKK